MQHALLPAYLAREGLYVTCVIPMHVIVDNMGVRAPLQVRDV